MKYNKLSRIEEFVLAVKKPKIDSKMATQLPFLTLVIGLLGCYMSIATVKHRIIIIGLCFINFIYALLNKSHLDQPAVLYRYTGVYIIIFGLIMLTFSELLLLPPYFNAIMMLLFLLLFTGFVFLLAVLIAYILVRHTHYGKKKHKGMSKIGSSIIVSISIIIVKPIMHVFKNPEKFNTVLSLLFIMFSAVLIYMASFYIIRAYYIEKYNIPIEHLKKAG